MAFQHNAFQHNAFQVGSGTAAASAVVRGPTLQQEKRPREVIATVAVNLLISTLAAVSPPIVPKVHAAPQQYIWQVQNTSAGTPKTLTQDGQLPFLNVPYTAPDRLRPVVDTSQKQPITLQVIVPPAPIVNLPNFGPVWYPSLPADTSARVPKTLTQDNQLPFLNVPHTQPDRLRPVVDTSQKQPMTLQTIVPPPPIVNLPHYPPVRYPSLPADTSRSSAKTLFSDAQTPFFTSATFSFTIEYKAKSQVQGESYGTPQPIFNPPVGPVTVTHYGVGFSGVSLPKRDSVRKIEQESVSYKEVI